MKPVQNIMEKLMKRLKGVLRTNFGRFGYLIFLGGEGSNGEIFPSLYKNTDLPKISLGVVERPTFREGLCSKLQRYG